MGIKLAFLDRDGTLNDDLGYVHRIEDWHFALRAPEALAILQNNGFRLAVVTNQSGISTGRYSLADVDCLHQQVRQLLVPFGVHLDLIAICPHAADGNCECRKPKTGMAIQIESLMDAEIDYPACWTIGDKLSDVEFGHRLGTHTALLQSRYWTPAAMQFAPDIIVASLYDAAQRITQWG